MKILPTIRFTSFASPNNQVLITCNPLKLAAITPPFNTWTKVPFPFLFKPSYELDEI